MSTVASTDAALDAQYYEGLAADAAESGSTYANECLKANNYVSTWGLKSLRPATDCSGNSVSGQSATVVSTPRYVSTYRVGPVNNTTTGTQTMAVIGTVSLLRQSDGTTWKTYTNSLAVKVGGQIGIAQVVFGYAGFSGGAFFGAVGGDGILRSVGYNAFGQLGNGTTNNTLIPTAFMAPTSNKIVAGYANFMSLGYRMFAVDDHGIAYGAGYNYGGSLGTGSTVNPLPTPAQVVMPGKMIRSVVPGGGATYFITTDNNVYSAGECARGLLGSNYTITGCSNVSVPTRVALPTPYIANQNTIPTDNLVTDSNTAFMRMAGGAVYGWGAGNHAQLGSNSFADSSNPVKIGTYGDAGQPAATQIAFDGETLYVLDSLGKVSSIGLNSYGGMGTRSMSLYMEYISTGKCMENANSDGVNVQLANCTGAANQKFVLRADNSVYNLSRNVCLENYSGTSLRLTACNGSTRQQFVWDPWIGSLKNVYSAQCVDNYYGNGVTLWVYGCNASGSQHFSGYNAEPTAFDTTGMTGTVTKIWTDMWSLSCLTSTGQVWSAGINNSGQFGNGTANIFQPNPVKFNMPVPAVNIYETNNASPPDISRQNLYAVGSNGRVYGAGANSFGQLGNGTFTTNEVTPVTMSVIDGATAVATQVQTGFGTTVVYTADGSVYTVGSNSFGQLGDGTTTNSSIPLKAKYVNIARIIRY